MQKIPAAFYSIRSNIIFCIASAVFFLLFAILYVPTFRQDDEVLILWSGRSDMCLTIISAIILLSVAVSRSLMIILTHRHRISEREYLAWQLCEIMVTGFFIDLFLSLFFRHSFFDLLPRVLAMYFAITLFPCTVYWLIQEFRDRERQLQQSLIEVEQMRQGIEQLTPATLNFPDENGNIKLAVNANQVISIEAAANYVTILYEDDERLVRFALRNTLKSIELICEGSQLVRCHRSFLINTEKIKLLRKDPSGLFAEMRVAGVDDIPVSKTYSSHIMQRFSIH